MSESLELICAEYADVYVNCYEWYSISVLPK